MVFTDLDMPKLDGFGLLSRIRASGDRRIKQMPVVVISGDEDAARKQRARELGANDFIAKSADAPEVLSRLDNVLRLVRTSNELEVSRRRWSSTATHDPLTGTHTANYLVTEGSQALRAGAPPRRELSVMALRLDTYDDIALARGQGHRRRGGHARRQAGHGEGAHRGLGGARGARHLHGGGGGCRGAADAGGRRSGCSASWTRRRSGITRSRSSSSCSLGVRLGGRPREFDRGPDASRAAAAAAAPAAVPPAAGARGQPGLPADLERVLRYLEERWTSRGSAPPPTSSPGG